MQFDSNAVQIQFTFRRCIASTWNWTVADLIARQRDEAIAPEKLPAFSPIRKVYSNYYADTHKRSCLIKSEKSSYEQSGKKKEALSLGAYRIDINSKNSRN